MKFLRRVSTTEYDNWFAILKPAKAKPRDIRTVGKAILEIGIKITLRGYGNGISA